MSDNVEELLAKYDQRLVELQVDVREVDGRPATFLAALQHLRWMIRQVRLRARRDGWSERKVNRWLGFIQGTLFVAGLTDIPSLRDDSRDLYSEVGTPWVADTVAQPPA